MKAVWSFWSKPFFERRGSSWFSDAHFFFSWVISVETARSHCEETALVTDDLGAELLVHILGLRFDLVSTSLNELAAIDPGWWALGKLYAYREQRKPFVHLDADVFLWHPLPSRITAASVFAQSPERFWPSQEATYYKLRRFEKHIRDRGGWLPLEWGWYSLQPEPLEAACCGIFGGVDIDFIRHYADQAIRVVERPEHRAFWKEWGDVSVCNVLVEQYYLNASVEYRRSQVNSSFAPTGCEYLFSDETAAHNPENSRAVGYTHLLANSKRNASIVMDLQWRVMQQFPDHFARCLAAAEKCRKIRKERESL